MGWGLGAGRQWKCWLQGTSVSMYPLIHVAAKKKKSGPCSHPFILASEWGVGEPIIERTEHLMGCRGWHASPSMSTTAHNSGPGKSRGTSRRTGLLLFCRPELAEWLCQSYPETNKSVHFTSLGLLVVSTFSVASAPPAPPTGRVGKWHGNR